MSPEGSVRAVILEQIRTVAAEQRKVLPPLTDDLPFQESGLELLCASQSSCLAWKTSRTAIP